MKIANKRISGRLLIIMLLVVTVVASIFYFMQCKRDRYLPEGCVVFSATQSAVAKYTPEEPERNIIYAVDPTPAGETMITAVAYDPARGVLAVGLTSKEPKKAAAKIVLLGYKSSLPISVINTNKDRISGIALGRNGEIVFTTRDVNLDLPGELCVIDGSGRPAKTIAEGKFFGKPSWSTDSKKIYFSYHTDAEKAVGYVDMKKPGIITKIDDGLSITVSDSGRIALLTANGEIVFLDDANKTRTIVKLPSKFGDKFTDRILFVKGTEDIILQRYAFSVVSDLLIVDPPYTNVKLMLPHVGMQDFDAAGIKH